MSDSRTKFEAELECAADVYTAHRTVHVLKGGVIKRPTPEAFADGARWALQSQIVRELKNVIELAMDAGLLGTGNIYFDAKDALARYRDAVGGGK